MSTGAPSTADSHRRFWETSDGMPEAGTAQIMNHTPACTHPVPAWAASSPAAAQTRRGPPRSGGWQSAPRSRLWAEHSAGISVTQRQHRQSWQSAPRLGEGQQSAVLEWQREAKQYRAGWRQPGTPLGSRHGMVTASSSKLHPHLPPASSCRWISAKRSAWPSTLCSKSTRPLQH